MLYKIVALVYEQFEFFNTPNLKHNSTAKTINRGSQGNGLQLTNDWKPFLFILAKAVKFVSQMFMISA